MSAHLLGFVGQDIAGQEQGYFGLEGYFDRYLKGREGKIRTEKDADGNPIPGSGFVGEDALPLADIHTGSDFTVARIPETLEFTPGLLDFLETSALLPGRRGTVSATNTDGSVVVSVNGTNVTVDAYASSKLMVVAAG